MHITFVKKILGSGELCKKCREVSERLESEGFMNAINLITNADERDSNSEGARLAKLHGVTRAPFFLVEVNGDTIVFDIYFKFKKFMVEQGFGNALQKPL
jgi:hypothetical protein